MFISLLMHIDRSIEIATGRKRPPRYTFDVHFTSEEEKEAFTTRLKSVRQLLTPNESRSKISYNGTLSSRDFKFHGLVT